MLEKKQNQSSHHSQNSKERKDFKRRRRPSRNSFHQNASKFSMVKQKKILGSNLNASQLTHKVKTETSTSVAKPHPIQNNFTDFKLDPKLLKNITDKGYRSPTPIQDQAIPHLLEERDLIGLANTGTGKTAAFLIPLINKILGDRTQKALILAPTRELAVQIEEELRSLTQGMNIYSILSIGGTNINEQIRRIKSPFNFLIGTPGRVMDLEKRRALYLDRFQNVVLDEADRMVDMGFIHDMKFIFSKLPKQRHSMFFTATLEKEVEGLVHQFLKNPLKVSVKKRETSGNIEQNIIQIQSHNEKLEKLVELLAQPDFKKVLVFGRTKFGVEKLAKKLASLGLRVNSIHGNKSQNYRLKALQSFKLGHTKILIATDIAARGLDIDNVTHVINYDLPANYEDYVHRIGRTGRAEQKGIALSFVIGK